MSDTVQEMKERKLGYNKAVIYLTKGGQLCNLNGANMDFDEEMKSKKEEMN